MEKSAFIYTYCYCEENIYKLCESLLKHKKELLEEKEELFVVFISNEAKKVPFFQRDNSHVFWVKCSQNFTL